MKVLVVDVETAPKKAYIWKVWKENVPASFLIDDYYMLSWSAKWLGEDVIYGQSLAETEEYKTDSEDDSGLLTSLWDMLNEADVVIAHNGQRFDIPVINTRLIKAGMMPPSPYKLIDTLKEAKKHFKFTYNRLDYLGDFLGVGRKIDTGGFGLWVKCLEGDERAFKDMLKYNKQDVQLLEDVYLKLRPYMKQHPNFSNYRDVGEPICTKCGSNNIEKDKHVYTSVSRFVGYRCQDCGSFARGRANTKGKSHMKNTLMSA